MGAIIYENHTHFINTRKLLVIYFTFLTLIEFRYPYGLNCTVYYAQ